MRINILLIAFTLILVSLIVTLNIFFNQNYQQDMAAQLNKQQLIIARAVSATIKNDLHHIQEELEALSRLLKRRGLGPEGFSAFVVDGFAEESIEEGISLKVFDPAGKVLFPADSVATEEDMRMFTLSRELKEGQIGFFDHIVGHQMVEFSAAVRDETGRILGVVLTGIDIDSLTARYLEPIKTGELGYAWMMDSSGTLIFHPTAPGMVGKNIHNADASCFECHASFEMEKDILGTYGDGYTRYSSPAGTDKLVAFSRLSFGKLSWIVCVSIPYSEVITTMRKSMALHSMLVIAIFAMTVMGAFVMIITNRSRVKAEEKARHLERQRALETEIIHAKDYLENILESTQTIIVVVNRDLVVRTVNTAYEKIVGQAKEEVEGRNFFDVFPFDSDQSRRQALDAIGDVLRGEIRHIKDVPVGSGDDARRLSVICSPLRIGDLISGVILSGLDETEELLLKEKIRDYAHELEVVVKERTQELRLEKEKLDTIVESIEAGMCIFDAHGRLTWTNRLLQAWLPEETSTISLEQLGLDGHDGAGVPPVDLQGRENITQEIMYRDFGRKSGDFQITSTPLDTPDGETKTLVLIQDVTEVRLAEQRMMQTERLSALARLSAGVAHEIGNPLTSISSYVQILKEMDFDDFTRDALDTVAKHINRIAAIVLQMSSFTKAEGDEIQKINVSSVLRSTLQLVRYDKRLKNVTVREDMPEQPPLVKASEDQLQQVFINMVLNAGDAMQNGGVLSIAVRSDETSVYVEFTDSGSGIPKEYMDRIFDPFFTTKEKGTGLGLSVSYTIIRSFGGSISASSIPGEGTTLTVRLPRYEG